MLNYNNEKKIRRKEGKKLGVTELCIIAYLKVTILGPRDKRCLSWNQWHHQEE